MKRKSITSERGTVFYWIAGNNDEFSKCIVFTHGLTANHTMFRRQVDYFSAGYTVITWDVPMHGESRPYGDFSYEHTAMDLRAILDAEKVGKAVLVGMSMGGYPSQAFAAGYPERVEAFIALDTTPFGTSYYSSSDLWWLKRAGPMARWYPAGMLRRSMARSVSAGREAFDLMMDMLAPLSKADICEQMDIAYGQFVRENRDIRLTCPVLIILGDRDKTGKVRQYCRRWSEKEGYPLVIIPNAAHMANVDNHEAVNEAISRFISNGYSLSLTGECP